jgi:hypothetical protein
VGGVNEVGGLGVVDCLDERAMEEGIIGVELGMGQPLEMNRVSTVRTMEGLTTGLKVSL